MESLACCRAPEVTTAVASQIEPGGHSHVGPVVPTASKVDNWSSESNPWACVHPPPLPPQTRPSSSHPPAHHLEPSIQEDRPVSSPFVTASDDYEVSECICSVAKYWIHKVQCFREKNQGKCLYTSTSFPPKAKLLNPAS